VWFACAVLVLVAAGIPPVSATDLSLDQALDRAMNKTARGDMIRGNEDVARQYYSARRTNLYFPEISINGSIPSYTEDKSYRGLQNSFDKSLYQTTALDFRSDIELKQTLLTGGSLTARVNLVSEDNEYPNTRYDPALGTRLDESSKRGFFSFSLEQPLFRPSSTKNELHNRKDDLEIAKMTRIEEGAGLRKEVTEAYLSVLQLALKAQLSADKLEQARLQESIDSAKLSDGILSEEDFLLSSSARLDAELEFFEVKTEREEQQRELATLLDLDISEQLVLTEPPLTPPLDSGARARLIAAWERTVPIIKAEHQYEKAKREADFAASGHGLTGDLNANYNFGQQKVETSVGSFSNEQDINTSGWTISLDFRLPLWDGGAGSAAIQASRYQAEQAKYEFTRAKRSARAQIMNLLNQLDVSYSRLEIIRKQIELADNRHKIAQSRFDDGQISQLTLLESRVFYLETKDKYLEELKSYQVNRIDLDGKFIN